MKSANFNCCFANRLYIGIDESSFYQLDAFDGIPMESPVGQQTSTLRF